MKFIGMLILIIILSPLELMATEGANDLKPYPPAEAGFERWVFRVPPVAREEDHRIEIVVGRTLSVDCNPTHLGGDLEQRTVQGWGYSYYVLAKVWGPASTLMACPPGQERTDAFVAVRGDGFIQRYNSKLPMVVYAPEGYRVGYRVWSADARVEWGAPE